jgi:uncharacterized membrane protein (DUF485 family)
MAHGPSTDWGADKASKFKTRIGVWMFALYGVVYAGFVLINTFYPSLMASDIGGLNLAIVYGFGLIFFALMLAFVYNAICSAAEEELNMPDSADAEAREAAEEALAGKESVEGAVEEDLEPAPAGKENA